MKIGSIIHYYLSLIVALSLGMGIWIPKLEEIMRNFKLREFERRSQVQAKGLAFNQEFIDLTSTPAKVVGDNYSKKLKVIETLSFTFILWDC
ncbi:hypothetical protein N780_13285 [Pontibacillus chungwhensis BH030062]|uniref:Uncharacterized protein n=1 Tax=Pontibacillus chungwhensis BH030062 TaxID=1385513 RepID=A0A0A2UZG7_9BACI|nr:hypothetical protein N780_13285 [Pontibacillus chungwhensis BH030062]